MVNSLIKVCNEYTDIRSALEDDENNKTVIIIVIEE